MYKLIALFHDFKDPEAFTKYHAEEIEPELLNFPGVLKVEVTKLSLPSSNPNKFDTCFLLSQMYFASKEALLHAITEKQGTEFASYFLEKAGDISTIFVGSSRTYYPD